MKTVGELHINNADLAEHPFRYHLSRLLDHLVTGITVRDADNFILLFAQRQQLARFVGGKAQRFFANNVQPGFKRRFSDSEVSIVRRSYRYGFNAVRAFGLLREQRLVIGVAAFRSDAELLAELTTALGIDIKRAGEQSKDVVAKRRTAVAVANLAGAAAADHSPAQGAG